MLTAPLAATAHSEPTPGPPADRVPRIDVCGRLFAQRETHKALHLAVLAQGIADRLLAVGILYVFLTQQRVLADPLAVLARCDLLRDLFGLA